MGEWQFTGFTMIKIVVKFKWIVRTSDLPRTKRNLNRRRTDIEIEISNQGGRLVADVIIYYNFAILSRLFVKYEASLNPKFPALIKKRDAAVVALVRALGGGWHTTMPG